jgi:hypothetical protein
MSASLIRVAARASDLDRKPTIAFNNSESVESFLYRSDVLNEVGNVIGDLSFTHTGSD